MARSVFPEDAIFRIDHYLGKEAIMNLLYFRFANSFLEPLWCRDHITSVQMTMSEDFGVGDRGAFYETAGTLRDVVENHLFQIVALLAMEPPKSRGFADLQAAKADVFKAMRPLKPEDIVRGQYDGYRKEKDVAPDSDVETFVALRLFVEAPRWKGVPFYLRAGKLLPNTAVEVQIQFKPPQQALFEDAGGRPNYLRFRLQPTSSIALAARVKDVGKEFVGEQRELYACEDLSRRGGAVRPPAGRRDERRRLAVHQPRIGGGRVVGGRRHPREPPGRRPVRARHLGPEGSRCADRRRRRLAGAGAREGLRTRRCKEGLGMSRTLTHRSSWKALVSHHKKIAKKHLRELFDEDATRGTRLTLEAAGLYLDYSKNRVNDETMKLLVALAEDCELQRTHRRDVPRRADQHHREPRRAARGVARAARAAIMRRRHRCRAGGARGARPHGRVLRSGARRHAGAATPASASAT